MDWCILAEMNWFFLKRRVHVSWLIAICAAGIILGVITSQYIHGFHSIMWLIIGCALLTTIMGRNVIAIPFVVAAGCIIGLWRGSIDQVQIDMFRVASGNMVAIEGVVAEDPVRDNSGRLKISIHALMLNERSTSGAVWVSTASQEEVRRGDTVRVKGEIKEGFGGFAASMGYADLVSVRHPESIDPMMQLRDGFVDMVRKVIPDPEASLGLGYVVGQRSLLPPDIDEALKIAGLTHIVVASGYNLTILVRLSRRLLMRISKFTAAVSATGLIVGFIGITGGISGGIELVGVVLWAVISPTGVIAICCCADIADKPCVWVG